jgi:hypothetical protein
MEHGLVVFTFLAMRASFPKMGDGDHPLIIQSGLGLKHEAQQCDCPIEFFCSHGTEGFCYAQFKKFLDSHAGARLARKPLHQSVKKLHVAVAHVDPLRQP